MLTRFKAGTAKRWRLRTRAARLIPNLRPRLSIPAEIARCELTNSYLAATAENFLQEELKLLKHKSI